MFDDLNSAELLEPTNVGDVALGGLPAETLPAPHSTGYPLAMAREGELLSITSMHGGCRYRRQLMDMGLRPGIEIEVLRAGGWGPILILAGETRLGIGRGMAEKIEVLPLARG